MGNPKFNSEILRYFVDNNTAVRRFIYSQYLKSNLDYFSFFSFFLNRYGIAMGIVANIQDNTYRAYISFSPNNIMNQVAGEINLIEKASSDQAHEVLAKKLINILKISKYNHWTKNERL